MQPQKALSPIDVTLSGKVMEDRDMQSLKAPSHIFSIPSGSSISESDEYPKDANSPQSFRLLLGSQST